MNANDRAHKDQLAKELNYYRREYNDLGARVLGLQEEQSRAFREARRSRTVARLIREAYRLADRTAIPEEIGSRMLEIVVDNALCERAAILHRVLGEGQFDVTHALGFYDEPAPDVVTIPSPPVFHFTTPDSDAAAPAHELTEILRVPFILWAFDPISGYALIIGNRSDGNVIRPFEQGDEELIEGALSVYVDIILRKQAEAELRAAKMAAERADNSKSAFLATLSHELRTPLNAIIGFSDILQSGLSKSFTPDKWREYARDIHSAGTYLLSLINDILDYSALAKEAPTLHAERMDTADLIVQATDTVKMLAKQKNVALFVDAPPHIPSVTVDQRRMTQVLVNVLSNAIKFSPEGSRIKLRAQISSEDGALILEIEDSGVGIAQADIPRVFEPFVQIGDSYKNAVKGTGLGLPISRSLVEAHGGTINLRSRVGIGTTVIIRLPAWRVGSSAVTPA